MALTSIGQQKTPGRPTEITFAPETGIPSDSQEVVLIGHAQAGYPASGLYKAITISNSADLVAASGECVTKGFGAESELTKMVLAAIQSNAGGSTFPQLKVIALASTDVDFGANQAALLGLQKTKAEFPVSPYDGLSTDLRNQFKLACQTMSGASRVQNNQYGSIGVVVNVSEADPGLLPSPDTQFLAPIWYRNAASGGSVRSIAEIAAWAAAKMASNGIPFNPLDDEVLTGLEKPTNDTDNISVGAGLESEVALQKGWTPLRILPNGDVAFVRTVTSRISIDGTGQVAATAYYDVQDFQVLYFWRKTLFTRFSQPDFKKRKASGDAAKELKGEAIRLAGLFEDQQMFQAVSKLAKEFKVERNASDRSRFDVLTPVNVIPGLHVIATNVQATTKYDVITV